MMAAILRYTVIGVAVWLLSLGVYTLKGRPSSDHRANSVLLGVFWPATLTALLFAALALLSEELIKRMFGAFDSFLSAVLSLTESIRTGR